MERVHFLEHKGKKVLYVDYSGLKANSITEVLDEVKRITNKEPRGSLFMLCNFESMQFNSTTISQFKSFTTEFMEYNKAVALIGIKGLQKIAYEAVSKIIKTKMPIFNTKEEALDWLTNK